MAGTKTIFNATGQECFVELLAREQGVVLDSSFITAQLQAIDATTVTMRLTGLADGPAGLSGKYRNVLDYRYNKVVLSRIFPTDFTYSGVYPTTAQALFNSLLTSHDLRFENGDLALVQDASRIPLTNSTVINQQPGESGALRLQVMDSSLRFEGGEQFNLFITSTGTTGWSPLTLTGNAPDGSTGSDYTYQYAVTGGRTPYQFAIVAGEAPAQLDPVTGAFTGPLQATGNLEWTVQVTDDRGIAVSLTDTASIAVDAMTMETTALPDATTAAAYSARVVVRGGVPPYAFTFLSGAPVDASIDELGMVAGQLDYGTYNVVVRCTDLANTVIQRTLPLNVLSRTPRQLAQTLLASVVNWFEFDQQQFPDGAVLDAIYTRGNGAHTLEVVGDGAVGSPSTVQLNGQWLEGTQQYPQDLAVSVFYQSTNTQHGAGVVGRMTDQIGWGLYVDETALTKMVFSVALDGRNYAVISSDAHAFNTGDPTLVTAQRTGTSLQLHYNATLSARTDVPADPIDTTTTEQFKVGHRSVGTVSGYWNAQVSRLLTSTQRLWGDQLTYLYNGGLGRTYLMVAADAQS
jgi:hypothetical protein